MSILHSTFLSILQHSNKIMSGNVVQIVFSHSWSYIHTWLCCVMSFIVSKWIEYGPQSKSLLNRHHRIGNTLWLWCLFIWRQRYFSLEWQIKWPQTTYWHKLHTVDWKFTLSNFCTCSPQVYSESQWVMKEPPHITEDFTHSLCMLFFLEINFWWKKKADITPVHWTNWHRMVPMPDAMVLQEMYFWQLLCRWDTIRGTFLKITGRHKKRFTWPLKEIL